MVQLLYVRRTDGQWVMVEEDICILKASGQWPALLHDRLVVYLVRDPVRALDVRVVVPQVVIYQPVDNHPPCLGKWQQQDQHAPGAKVVIVVEKEREKLFNATGDCCGERERELERRLEA